MATRFNRHVTRLCGSCDAPMARQEETCWQCGAAWTAGATVPAVAPVAAPVPVLEPAVAQR
jgi:predicted amidophosphoribosyltransferase